MSGKFHRMTGGMLAAAVALSLQVAGAATERFADDVLVKSDFTGQTPLFTGKCCKGPAEIMGRAYFTDIAAGRALHLNGEGQLFLPETENLKLPDDATFEAVFRPSRKTGPDTFDGVFFKDGAFLLAHAKGTLYFNCFSGGKWNVRAVAPKLPECEWVHVAVTVGKEKDGRVVRYYVNGKHVYRTGVGAPEWSGSSKPMIIGTCWGTQWRFHGEIATVAIYGRALSAKEIGILHSSAGLDELKGASK